jgi:hypothetical protein
MEWSSNSFSLRIAIILPIWAWDRLGNFTFNQQQYIKMKDLSALALPAVCLASAVSAATAFSSTGYVINRFALRIPRALPYTIGYRNSSLSFDLIDLEPLVNKTSWTNCMASWNGSSNGYPSHVSRVSRRAFHLNVALIPAGSLLR